MEIAKILLSSAVIVAIINVFLQNKSNKLNHITDERAEWRRCLKNIVVEIEESRPDTIKKTLTELKININYYGNFDFDSINEERMDVFKDQHIWKSIHLLEECCDKDQSKEQFEKYKKRLIDYIGFLLKFDWERSKYETKSDFSIITSVLLIIAGAMSILVEYYTKNSNIKIWNVLRVGGLFALPSVFVWIPIILQKIEIMRSRNWYREVGYMLMSWLASIVCYMIILLITKYRFRLDLYVWSFLYFCSFVSSIFCILKERKVYIEYSNALNKYMKIDSVIIYYRKMSIGLLMAFIYLNKKGVEFLEMELKKETLDLKMFEKIENRNDKKIAKFIKRIKKSDKSVYDYTSKLWNRNKYIIKYNKGGKIYLTVGRNRRIWDKWFEL